MALISKLHGKGNTLPKGAKRTLGALSQSRSMMTAKELRIGMQMTDGDQAPGLTTIYRSLDLLERMGYIQQVHLNHIGDNEKRYQLVNPGEQHHHLVCKQCNEQIMLKEKDCLISKLETAVEAEYGFKLQSHVLQLFGLCGGCLQNQNPTKYIALSHS